MKSSFVIVVASVWLQGNSYNTLAFNAKPQHIAACELLWAPARAEMILAMGYSTTTTTTCRVYLRGALFVAVGVLLFATLHVHVAVEAADSECQNLAASPTLTPFVDELPIMRTIHLTTKKITIGAWKIKQVKQTSLTVTQNSIHSSTFLYITTLDLCRHPIATFCIALKLIHFNFTKTLSGTERRREL